MSAKNRSTCVLVVKKISVNHSPYHVDVTHRYPKSCRFQGLRKRDTYTRRETIMPDICAIIPFFNSVLLCYYSHYVSAIIPKLCSKII